MSEIGIFRQPQLSMCHSTFQSNRELVSFLKTCLKLFSYFTCVG
jgi:hypothetical protein